VTPREAVMLTRYVEACCPQQKIDEYTPDAWHNLLGDLTIDDCRAAVDAVARQQPFVAPAEIRAEVRRIRTERITAGPIPDPGTGDPAEYIRRLKASTRAVADGTLPPLAIEAGDGADAWDNPTVRKIREMFDAEQADRRAAREAEHKAAREATRAYIDAQEVLIALDDLGEGAMAQAFEDLFGEAQAAAGFPLATGALGVTDQQKTVIHAARLAKGIPA
jgi:hypothetical protein